MRLSNPMTTRPPRRLPLFLFATMWFLPPYLPGGAVGSKLADQQSSTAQPPTGAQGPQLADFAWLAGTWQGSWGPRTAEQAWALPASGVMTGVVQISENGKSLVTELF